MKLLTLLALVVWTAPAQARTALPSSDRTADDVIAKVNTLRAAQGLPPYQVNAILMEIAQAHAEYMAISGVLTHFGPGGSRPFQRAVAGGYSVDGDLDVGGDFSESIAAGVDLSPSGAIVRWQGDSFDLNTMISADLQDIGAGVATVGGMTYYVVDVGASAGAASNTPSPASAVITPTAGTQSAPVLISTPLENGTVFHVVQSNEALWSIALAYELTIEELKQLNRLSSDDIFIGQKLLIKKLDLSTSTVQPSFTVTFGIPTSTATHPVTPARTLTPTPIRTPPASHQSGGMVAGGIVVAAALAAALGAWLARKKPVDAA